MSNSLKQLARSCFKPVLRGIKSLPFVRILQPYKTVRYCDIDVYYKDFLDGGGTYFGQDFIPFFRDRGMPVQARVYEWCSGPAFIAFSMLAHKFCDSLCLADVNPAAVKAARMAVGRNGLADKVAVYHSDNLSGIPSHERWDLVVSNPPHFDDMFVGQIRSYDEGWNLHRAFLRDVQKFLAPNGVIVLQENNEGSTVETFRGMIEAAGLKIIFTQHDKPQRTPTEHYFYLGIMRRDDTPPAWAHA